MILFLFPHPAFGHLPPEWEGVLSFVCENCPVQKTQAGKNEVTY